MASCLATTATGWAGSTTRLAKRRTRSVSTAAADSVTSQSGLPKVMRSPVDSVENGPASMAGAQVLVVAAV